MGWLKEAQSRMNVLHFKHGAHSNRMCYEETHNLTGRASAISRWMLFGGGVLGRTDRLKALSALSRKKNFTSTTMRTSYCEEVMIPQLTFVPSAKSPDPTCSCITNTLPIMSVSELLSKVRSTRLLRDPILFSSAVNVRAL